MALALNNALASVALGSLNMKRWQQMRIAVVFALFEALMPVIGIVVGEDVAGLIGDKARIIGISVLALAGVYSLLKSAGQDEVKTKLGFRTLLLAAALSLDNLTVGFGLGMFDIPMSMAAAVFGIVSLVMTFVGLELGRFFGSRVSWSADRLSGVVLLLTAGIMLIH